MVGPGLALRWACRIEELEIRVRSGSICRVGVADFVCYYCTTVRGEDAAKYLGIYCTSVFVPSLGATVLCGFASQILRRRVDGGMTLVVGPLLRLSSITNECWRMG